MKNFFLLGTFNHAKRLFDFRLEDERGDAGSRHSLINYVAAMATQIPKVERGELKPHWRHPFWVEVLNDPSNVEQVVLARVTAPDSGEAKARLRPIRATLKQCYIDMGYSSFYTAYDAANQQQQAA